jgi:hypothetical protein
MEQFDVTVPAVLPGMSDESWTIAVKLKVPDWVGVPVIAPVLGFSVSPGGSEPLLMEKVYGAKPPVATSDEE